jgi:two-component system, NarL family, sensor histidine kinase UhpB
MHSMRALSENFNILLVEDNAADQFLLEQMLLSSRLKIKKIYSASTIKEAKELLKTIEINFVLLDLSLPDSFGIDSLKTIKSLIKRIPVIVLTGLADSDLALEALKQNAQDYLVKGEINTNLLIKSIEYSIERKKAEESIVASEEKYRQMFYKNPFPMWINDEHTLHILEVNEAAIQKYGYERNEFLALSLSDLQLSPAVCPHLSHIASEGSPQANLWKHRKKNGETIIVEFSYYPIDYFGKTAMQAQVNDITENVRLEHELSFQKKQLVEAILNAQEIERKTIGSELHDNINQVLTAVKLNLGLALQYKDNTTIISKCEKNIEEVMEEIRKLSKQLILPGNLKELGLVQSLQDMMKEILYSTGISWKIFAKGVSETLLSEEQKLTIYRIVQEQLTNILKHAEASSVAVTLNVTEERVQLKIVDNGKGFEAKKQRNGIGLTNIINRAGLFNGKVKINSKPGEGCSLEVELNSKQPLPLKTNFNDPVLKV